MNILDRNAILAADDTRRTTVEVPEWGGEVRLRSLSLAELLELTPKLKAEGDITVDLVILSVCDEHDEPILHREDADAIAKKAPAILQRVALAAATLNGLTGDSRPN